MASLRQQYGLRVNSAEFREMPWDEFVDLVSGLTEQTSLVRLAQIRTEMDPEVLKNFTPEQRAIRSDWQRRRALKRSKGDTQSFLDQMQEGLSRMFGEG